MDMETGRTLHGADYHPAVDVTAVSAWLPPRLRVLWDVVGGKAYDCFFAFLDAER